MIKLLSLFLFLSLISIVGAFALWLSGRVLGYRLRSLRCFASAFMGVAAFYIINIYLKDLHFSFLPRYLVDSTLEVFELEQRATTFAFLLALPIYYITIRKILALTPSRSIIVLTLSFIFTLGPAILFIFYLRTLG